MDTCLPHLHTAAGNADILRHELAAEDKFALAAEFMRELGDPVRIRLFWVLCHREDCVVNLASILETSSPALSHHLRQLRDRGIISSRRVGREVYYRSADSDVCRLLHHMIEGIMNLYCPRDMTEGSDTAVVRRVHDYLIENMGKRITIEELSRTFNMNPTTLKACFKAEYGTSLAAHIKEHRMEEASRLLKSTRDSISRIAAAVGYGSQSRFCSAFKEVFGVSPTDYRKE